MKKLTLLMISIHKIIVLWKRRKRRKRREEIIDINLMSKIKNQITNSLNSHQIHTQTIFLKTKNKINKIIKSHHNNKLLKREIFQKSPFERLKSRS